MCHALVNIVNTLSFHGTITHHPSIFIDVTINATTHTHLHCICSGYRSLNPEQKPLHGSYIEDQTCYAISPVSSGVYAYARCAIQPFNIQLQESYHLYNTTIDVAISLRITQYNVAQINQNYHPTRTTHPFPYRAHNLPNQCLDGK